LSLDNFKIDFDDHYIADSKISIDSKENNENNVVEYALEVSYRCKEYGGTLVNYEMDFDIP
jgi:hypothetical protein